MIEESIIGTLLVDNARIIDVDLSGEEFENTNRAKIFKIIKVMLGKREVVDVLTVAQRLESETGRDYLSLLTDYATNGFTDGSNVKAYCQSVKDNYSYRRSANIGQWLLDNSKEEGAANEAIKRLMEIGKASLNHDHSMEEAMKLGIDQVKDAFENKGAIVGVPTGIGELDNSLGGLHDGDLVIVGARPAMGKTATLLNFMSGARESVGMVSGEQGVGQIIQRYWSIKSQVALMKMRNGDMDDQDWGALERGASLIKNGASLRFYDKPNPTIDEIESTARRWKFEYNIKALYVDYLQKIKRDPKKSKHESVGDNVSRLKDLARELEIPVVCLAQVSRAVESRQDRRPNMGDLSDSSEIEKEADQVIMLYRDEVYNPDSDFKGTMELLLEKNRHGSTGRIVADWDGRFLTLKDRANHGY